MMSEQEIKYEVFNCSKMGAKVKITREIFIHRSTGTGEIDGKFATSIDCDHKSVCGVGKSGAGISYDWTKCVHPDLNQ